jgi:hypothetical protein
VIYPAVDAVVLPAVLVAIRVTVYVPAVVYVCDGFSSVDVFPSPNDQIQEVGELIEESTNWMVSGAVPEVTVDRNDATGIVATPLATIQSALVTVLLPPALVAVMVTVYVPAVEYVCTGFWSEDVVPSPNDQIHDAGEFVDRSTNWTPKGTVPVVTFGMNAATGADATLLTVIYPPFVTVLLPAVFVAVRITVYVPAVV